MNYLLRNGEDLIKNIMCLFSVIDQSWFITSDNKFFVKNIIFSKERFLLYRDSIRMILSLIFWYARWKSGESNYA